MYQEKTLFYFYCETPLHAGSGSELGIVDLPIQRERATAFPKIEASSLKGAIREHFCRLGDGEKDKLVNRYFGPAPDADDANTKAGAVAFTDGRLLCLPVRSAAGVFTWVTCPGIVNRWKRDANLKTATISVAKGEARVCSSSDVIATGTDQIVLEEFAFTAKTENQPFELAVHLSAHLFPDKAGWHDKLINDLVILNDEDFGYFAENATEVITRVRISQQTGTVSPGALWTEEYLPAESILYSLVLTSDEFVTQEAEKEDERKRAGEIMTYMTDTVRRSPRFQLGGNATLGKGHLYTALHAIH